MSDASTLLTPSEKVAKKRVRFYEPALFERVSTLSDDVTGDSFGDIISAKLSLTDKAFQTLGRLSEMGVTPSPRYSEWNRWISRLSSTRYQNCKPTILKMKLLLHLDGYLAQVSTPVLDLKLFRNGLNDKVALSLLRASLKTLFGVNPKRFRFRKPEPETLREKSLSANLELNKALTLHPDEVDGDYIPNNVWDTYQDYEVPILDRRLSTRYEVIQTRKALYRGSIKTSPSDPTEEEYLAVKAKTRRRNFVADKIIPICNRIVELRKLGLQKMTEGLEPIEFYELLVRYDKCVSELKKRDFLLDPAYIKSWKPTGIPVDNIPIKFNVRNILLGGEPQWITYLSRYVYLGKQVPLDGLEVTSNLKPLGFVQELSMYFRTIEFTLSSLSDILIKRLDKDEQCTVDTVLTSLSRELAWRGESSPLEGLPPEFFINLRKSLRLSLMSDFYISSPVVPHDWGVISNCWKRQFGDIPELVTVAPDKSEADLVIHHKLVKLRSSQFPSFERMMSLVRENPQLVTLGDPE